MAIVPSSGSLYVGDLDPTVGEQELFQCFSAVGILSSVRVCRDRISGASLRYAYVNFCYRSDALKALKLLNHTKLKGKPMRIMWSHRDPQLRKTGIGNLFIKNLDLSVDSAKLHEAFAKFGSVLSCKVAEENGTRKGFGYVQFESEEAARHAVESLHGSIIGDKKVYVSKFVKKSERHAAREEPSFTNVYVNNLDHNLTDDQLKEKFSTFGTVKNAAIMKDDHGNSRGFGFVCFESTEDAKNAVETMNGTRIGSMKIYAGRAQYKHDRKLMLTREFKQRDSLWMVKFKGSNLYVKNLDGFVDDQELKEHFSNYGRVLSAKVMRDHRGISRGFGFVCFSTPNDANKAVDALHGSMFHDRQLYVAVAQRKEERRAILEHQFAQDSVPFPSCTSSSGDSSYYQSPVYYYQSPVYYYEHEPFGERQMISFPPSHGQMGYETTLPQMVSSKQGQQRQMEGFVNGITSQYHQHLVNLQSSVAQQFAKHIGGNWRVFEPMKSCSMNVNKTNSSSGYSYKGFGELTMGFTGTAPYYPQQVI